MTPTITIAGHHYPVAFDFATIIRYEELTGHTFDTTTLSTSISGQLDLYLAAIQSVTPTAFPDGRFSFYRSITLPEASAAATTIAPLIKLFFAYPSTFPTDSHHTTTHHTTTPTNDQAPVPDGSPSGSNPQDRQDP